MGEWMEVRCYVGSMIDNSECDITWVITPQISISLFVDHTNYSAVVISMLAIYALITNPLLLFVMV